MRGLLFIFLLAPISIFAQEWKQCIHEPKFTYTQNGDAATVNKSISFCFNETSFSIFDKDEKKIFPIINYDQQPSDIGTLEETFSNGKTNKDAEGDYSITISHGNPTSVTIQYNKEDGGTWNIITRSIPPVRKPETDTDK